MITTGGGGGFPVGGGPIEMLITLVLLVGVVWVAYRLLN